MHAFGHPRHYVRMARRRPFLITIAVLAAIAALLVVLLGGRSSAPLPRLPHPGTLGPAAAGDALAYRSDRMQAFVSRATAGEAHPLYTKTPGGAVATAARVARFRPLIDQVTAGTGVNPDVLEGIVFLESAGYPDAIAGGNPAGAAGLTQIVAATGTSALGMKINLARSQMLTAQIDQTASTGPRSKILRLEHERAMVDGRFDPRTALAATVRYLTMAERTLGRADLALESYHMGVGNLQRVLGLYDGGTRVPYAQLYFDSAPDHHAAAYQLLSSFADDSWTYYWRILAAEQIMHLYRTDRSALERQATLQGAAGSSRRFSIPLPRHRRSRVRRRWIAPTRATQSCPCRPTLPALGLRTSPAWGQSRVISTFRSRSIEGSGRPRCPCSAGSPPVSERCQAPLR